MGSKMSFRDKYDFYNRNFATEDFIMYKLSGNDYDKGAIETAQAQANNVTEAFARLVNVLFEQKKISKRDVYNIVGATPHENDEE